MVSGKLVRSIYLKKERICEERSICLLSRHKDLFLFFYLRYCNLSFMLLLKECCSLKMQSFFELCEDYWSLLSPVVFLLHLLEAAISNSCQAVSFL